MSTQDNIDFNWFNLNPEFNGKVFGRNFKWFNCFRRLVEGNTLYWGIGLLQIGKRHLFYIGQSSISILYIGKHTA